MTSHTKAGKSKTGRAAPRRPGGLRLDILKRRLNERGFVSVTETAEDFGVSEMTIRRDLARLEELSVAVRTHGGAIARGQRGGNIDIEEPAFESRARKNAQGKTAIAIAAASIARTGQTVGLDVGTTALELARAFSRRSELKIFTNNLRAAMVLSESSHQVYLAGGQIRPAEFSVYGSIGIAQIRQLWLDHAFIGVSGITEEGCFDYSLEDTEMKRAYIERSSHVVVLCDSHKFARKSLVQVCDLSGIDTLVTDAEPPAHIAAALRAHDTEIIVAAAV